MGDSLLGFEELGSGDLILASLLSDGVGRRLCNSQARSRPCASSNSLQDMLL